MRAISTLVIGAFALLGRAAGAAEPSCDRSDVALMMPGHVSDKRAELSGVLY